MTEASTLSSQTSFPGNVSYSEHQLNRAWWAVVARFLVHGLVVSTWVSRIPSIQSGLNLTNGALGLALLGAALGSVTAIPISGWMVSRYGSHRVTNWTSLGFCLSLALPGLAFNGPSLFFALFVYGAMAGANDVSMNAQGVAVEHEMRSPTMSRFHAMFSLGGMAGAAVGGLVAAQHLAPWIHLGVGGLLFMVITITTSPMMIELKEQGEEKSRGLRLNHLPPALLALCFMGFCIFLSEGAMADWVGVYLKQVTGAGPGTAATGYAVFSAGMAIFRLLGDSITLRLGPARTARIGSLVAAVGVSLALCFTTPGWALPGFAAAGAGFSVIIPLVFGAGGRVKGISRGAGVATVSGVGYMGFIFGPPAIGFISQATSLRWALLVVVALTLISALLSRAIEQVSEPQAEPA